MSAGARRRLDSVDAHDAVALDQVGAERGRLRLDGRDDDRAALVAQPHPEALPRRAADHCS
eukprot:1687520-Prymnesium_polylepis.1